jgi:hypothetical protein
MLQRCSRKSQPNATGSGAFTPGMIVLDKKYAVGALNVNSLKEFSDASPEDATGTAWRCSDLHSPDNSMVRNAQDCLHLQEVEGRLPCE